MSQPYKYLVSVLCSTAAGAATPQAFIVSTTVEVFAVQHVQVVMQAIAAASSMHPDSVLTPLAFSVVERPKYAGYGSFAVTAVESAPQFRGGKLSEA